MDASAGGVDAWVDAWKWRSPCLSHSLGHCTKVVYVHALEPTHDSLQVTTYLPTASVGLALLYAAGQPGQNMCTCYRSTDVSYVYSTILYFICVPARQNLYP